MKLKYSVILPVFNGMPYLRHCVESVISQDYQGYELVISDNSSTDGSAEYLLSQNHPSIVLLRPHGRLSMAEHWEFALSHARGEWQIFLGQDDALQSYFFQLADKLTSIACRRGLRAISSRRAYYFWPGCEGINKIRVQFSAVNRYTIKSTHAGLIRALFATSYFDLPQMYCSSIFHRELLIEARQRQGGSIFLAHPQDANLAAISCSLERKYLHSEIPLGWVGTSLKSAGLAVSSGSVESCQPLTAATQALRDEYLERVRNSRLSYNYLAGDFSFSDTCIYFWQALIQTSTLRPSIFQRTLLSVWFRFFLFSAAYARILYNRCEVTRRREFEEIILRNEIYKPGVIAVGILFFAISRVWRALYRVAYRIPQRSLSFIFPTELRFVVKSELSHDSTLSSASEQVRSSLKDRKWLIA